MRAVIQRVSKASVCVEEEVCAKIGRGLVVFLGIREGDGETDILWLAEKIAHLRIFRDQQGKMNLSAADIDGDVLIISQFTLYGDCRKGRRPGFSAAAAAEIAEPLYRKFIKEMQAKRLRVATGIFQAEMNIELTNDGPVTLLLDSEKTF